MARRKRSRDTTPASQQSQQKSKPASETASPGSQSAAEKTGGRGPLLINLLPLMTLVLACCLAYANAWPNNLAWDDAIFQMGDRLKGVNFSDIRSYFVDDAWAAIGGNTGIYRPLLLVSVALDIQVFGEWVAGFHLVNIFLHILVTLLTYGFIRYLLQACGIELPLSRQVAWLAALVFAIHPVHTEVVNSVFNRSEMLASVGMVGGLWWFLKSVVQSPWMAWGLIGVLYFAVMLCRETGVVLPAIMFVFLWILTPGSWQLRLKKCLPVFWLLLPLAIYFGLRAHALDTPMTVEEMATNRPSRTAQGLPVLGLYFQLGKLLPAVTIWFDSIKMMLWPDPLLTFHPPSRTNDWFALASQLALLVFAIVRMFQKRPGLILGLAFFYLSILPSSRILGELFVFPHLAERYLYAPSIGMTIVLAFALCWLAQRFTIKAALIPALAMIMFMTPLTFARNAEWSSTARLADADYRKNPKSPKLRQALVSSLLMKGDLASAADICDRHVDDFRSHWFLGGNCGQVYANLDRFDEAEQAFTEATHNRNGQAGAHYGLAALYLRQGRRQEALEHFDLAVSTEKQAFMKEYLAAEKLVRLYPSDKAKVLEARALLEKSIELQPQYYHGRQRLNDVEHMLNSMPDDEVE